MTIFRDPGSATVRLPAGVDSERGQSLIEYGLILAIVAVAAVLVLGVVGSTVSGEVNAVTAALQGGEGGVGAFGVPVPVSSSASLGAVAIGAVGLYLLRMRRN